MTQQKQYIISAQTAVLLYTTLLIAQIAANNNQEMEVVNHIKEPENHVNVEITQETPDIDPYDPTIARFINADEPTMLFTESVMPSGANLFVYCYNNPVMYLDPSGYGFWSQVGDIATSGLITLALRLLENNGVITTKQRLEITSYMTIIAGTILVFTPGMGAVGASMIGAGVGGLLGGNISELAGGDYELGWNIGSFVGGLVGGAMGGGAGAGAARGGRVPNAGARVGSSGRNSSVIQLNKNVSYGTAKRQYWKSQVGKFPGQSARLLKGKAPIGVDGHSMVLHHPFGRGGANLYRVEVMTRTQHIAFHRLHGYHFVNGVWRR